MLSIIKLSTFISFAMIARTMFPIAHICCVMSTIMIAIDDTQSIFILKLLKTIHVVIRY